MTGYCFDSIGNTINEGDLLMVGETPYEVREVEMMNPPVDPRQPVPSVRLVKLRLVRDVTMVVENGKAIRDCYKIHRPPPVTIKDEKPS